MLAPVGGSATARLQRVLHAAVAIHAAMAAQTWQLRLLVLRAVASRCRQRLVRRHWMAVGQLLLLRLRLLLLLLLLRLLLLHLRLLWVAIGLLHVLLLALLWCGSDGDSLLCGGGREAQQQLCAQVQVRRQGSR